MLHTHARTHYFVCILILISSWIELDFCFDLGSWWTLQMHHTSKIHSREMSRFIFLFHSLERVISVIFFLCEYASSYLNIRVFVQDRGYLITIKKIMIEMNFFYLKKRGKKKNTIEQFTFSLLKPHFVVKLLCWI